MINQFKFKFTCSMFQALQAHIALMRIPTRDVPFDKGKEKGKGKSGDELKRAEEYEDVRKELMREVYRHFEEGALKGKGKDKGQPPQESKEEENKEDFNKT